MTIELPGVAPAVSTIYLEMLRRPDSGAGALAESLGWTTGQVAAALDELARLALLRPSSETPGVLRPVAPELALEVILAQQEAELLRRRHDIEAGRAALRTLLAEQTAQRGFADNGVEELVGVDAVREALDKLAYRVEHEAMVLAPDGAQTAESIEASRPMNQRLLSRGVRMRTVYLSSARNDTRTTAHAQWLSEEGAEIRTVPVLPMRILIADRMCAIIPLDPDNTAAGACVLRGTGVVAVACALFEQIWAGAVPWCAARDHRGPTLSEQEKALLQRLASGETDEQVARKLGVSTRTVGRIVAELMARLNARSRFQAGAMAMDNGWI